MTPVEARVQVRRARPALAMTVGVVVVLVLGLPAPSAALAPRQPLWGSGDLHHVEMTVLTSQGSDAYQVARTDQGFRVRAWDDNTGGNLRVVLHRPGSPAVVDGESCARWGRRDGDMIQQGAALRIAQQGGTVRAITVTHNVFASPFGFNVHTWDSSRSGRPFRMVGQVDLRKRFFADGLPPVPWGFCARAIGDQVEFKVWSIGEPVPAWGDPIHSDAVTLPPGWVYPGRIGWFVGHLRPGEIVDTDDPSIWAYRVQQSMIPRVRRR